MASDEEEGTDNIVKLLEVIQMMEAHGMSQEGPINEMRAKVRRAVKTTSWTPGEVRLYILFTHSDSWSPRSMALHMLRFTLVTVLCQSQSWIWYWVILKKTNPTGHLCLSFGNERRHRFGDQTDKPLIPYKMSCGKTVNLSLKCLFFSVNFLIFAVGKN